MTDNETVMALSRRIVLESKLLSDTIPVITVRVCPLIDRTDIRELSIRKLDSESIRMDLLDPTDKNWNHHLTSSVTHECDGLFIVDNDDLLDIAMAHLKKSFAGDICYVMTIHLQDRVIHHLEVGIRPLIGYAINVCMLSSFTPKKRETT